MGQMPLKGLAKVRNWTIPNIWTMLLRTHPIVTKKHTKNNFKKLLIESSKSNEFQRFSNIHAKWSIC